MIYRSVETCAQESVKRSFISADQGHQAFEVVPRVEVDPELAATVPPWDDGDVRLKALSEKLFEPSYLGGTVLPPSRAPRRALLWRWRRRAVAPDSLFNATYRQSSCARLAG